MCFFLFNYFTQKKIKRVFTTDFHFSNFWKDNLFKDLSRILDKFFSIYRQQMLHPLLLIFIFLFDFFLQAIFPGYPRAIVDIDKVFLDNPVLPQKSVDITKLFCNIYRTWCYFKKNIFFSDISCIFNPFNNKYLPYC